MREKSNLPKSSCFILRSNRSFSRREPDVLSRAGPAWRVGAPSDEQPFTIEHAVHLQQLYQEQKVFIGGPCEDKSDLLSVVVRQASSETKAFEYIQEKPFVTQRMVELEVHPWQVVFEPRSAER